MFSLQRMSLSCTRLNHEKVEGFKMPDVHDMREIHNMTWEQAQAWIELVRDPNLTDNEVRIWVLLNLVHDGWVGINAAFDMCEDFGIFTKSRHTVARDFSKFMNPGLYKNEESEMKEIANDNACWTIKISDGFCAWEFYLQGGGDFSIDDLIQIVRVHTKMQILDERLAWTKDGGDVAILEE